MSSADADDLRYTASLAEARTAARATKRQDALVALARATAVLNAQLTPSAAGATGGGEAAAARGLVLDALDERLREYLATVEAVAGELKPYSYQITLGAPSGVSVGFTWRIDAAPTQA